MRSGRAIAPVAAAVFLLASCGGSGPDPSEAPSNEAPADRATTLAASTKPDLKVLSIHKVSETPILENVSDHVYQILVLNGRGAKSGYTATIVGVGQGTSIIDGSVLLGDLPSLGTSTPTDTITLRHDRAFPFIPARMVWEITAPVNGIPVPPQPDPSKNHATMAGVDTNANGIRDDIDILLATNFGTEPTLYAAAVTHAASLQAAIVSPSAERSAQHIASFVCVSTSLLQRLSDTTLATLDTPLRRAAYGNTFAGSTLSEENCQRAIATSKRAASATSSSAKAMAAAAPAHRSVIYINGIQNTEEYALEVARVIQTTLTNSPNHPEPNRRAFFVTTIWNPIGWDGTENGSLKQDEMELFLEKTAEEWFAEDFKKILAPHNQTREIGTDAAKAAAKAVLLWLEKMARGQTSLEYDGLISESNLAKTKTAVRALVSEILARQPAIVVAHSQGNLLANLAHASLAADHGNNIYKLYRVINVANTSQFAVSGLNLTHDKDRALDPLLTDLPNRGGNWYRTSPICNDCADDFVLAAPTFKADGLVDGDNLKNHSLVKTYLSNEPVAEILSQGVSFTPDKNGFVDRFEDLVYAAAASLDPFNLPWVDVKYPNADDTQLFDINNSGVVVGIATFGTSSIGFTYSNGVFTALPYPFGSNSFNGFTATGITYDGNVVGTYDTGGVDAAGQPITAGYLRIAGTYISFTLPGAVSTGIRGISSDGRYLAGDAFFPAGRRNYVHDRTTNTTKFVGPDSSGVNILQGVNPSGKAVGSRVALLADGSILQEGYVFDFASGSMTRVSDANYADREIRPRAIDDFGRVAGFVTGASGTKGFYGWPGALKTFEYPGAIYTYFYGNNDAGRLVGFAVMPSGEVRNFVFTPDDALVTFIATGKVTSIYDDASLGAGVLPVAWGDDFVAEYSFSPTAVDRSPTASRHGRYSVESASITIGRNSPMTFVRKENDHTGYGSYLDVSVALPPSMGGEYLVTFQRPVQQVDASSPTLFYSLALNRRDRVLFLSDALPLVPPDLALFPEDGMDARWQALSVCPNGYPPGPCKSAVASITRFVRK